MDMKKAVALAMKGEIEGRELYKMAASNTEDAKAKEVFSYLAEEEQKHFDWLKNLYDSVGKNEAYEVPSMVKLVRFDDVQNPIFSREFKNRIGIKHFEMSALSIALKLELDASHFYRKLAEECGDESLKGFFMKLSEWENGHYEALNQEISYLEDEYYQANHFSPF